MFESPDAVLETVRSGFGSRKVIVVGDLILDRYLWGKVQRISPEAPVPVVRLERETESPGGAANVARNLVSLGVRVVLVGVTGEDPGRKGLLNVLSREGIGTNGILVATDRATTVKTRVIGSHQQMIRIDSESTATLQAADRASLLAAVDQHLPCASALVLSDYAKGVLTDDLCAALIRHARECEVPVLVDPKGRNFTKYSGATLITPNLDELSLATGAPISDFDEMLRAATALRERLGLKLLVLTMSERGMVLLEPGGARHIPALARDVFDVSGAGDSVVASFAAGLSAGLLPADTAHLANLAAGVVVGKVGTSPVSTSELLAAIADESALEQAAKVCDVTGVQGHVRRWRESGERVVFTNGCFDLLHVGHVTYLERARRYGHRLIVGLNTDRSVRNLKGPNRPVIRERDRARVLAALASVDAVVLFDQDTPLDLIRSIRPDVLAKGADYKEEDVVGATDVKSWGGQVVLVPLVENKSTSGILQRMSTEEASPATS